MKDHIFFCILLPQIQKFGREWSKSQRTCSPRFRSPDRGMRIFWAQPLYFSNPKFGSINISKRNTQNPKGMNLRNVRVILHVCSLSLYEKKTETTFHQIRIFSHAGLIKFFGKSFGTCSFL